MRAERLSVFGSGGCGIRKERLLGFAGGKGGAVHDKLQRGNPPGGDADKDGQNSAVEGNAVKRIFFHVLHHGKGNAVERQLKNAAEKFVFAFGTQGMLGVAEGKIGLLRIS